MGTATCCQCRMGRPLVKHFIPLWGQQLLIVGISLILKIETFHTPMGTATTVPVILSTRYARNISYPYGDSNRPAQPHSLHSTRNISYPYGDSNPVFVAALRLPVKHFIPLWGQQRQDLIADISANTGNISYPYGDSNSSSTRYRLMFFGNISYPYGDSNLDAATAVIAT